MAACDAPAGFEVVGQPPGVVDPASATSPPSTTCSGEWAAAGATVVDLHLVHHSLDHYLEQLEALAS